MTTATAAKPQTTLHLQVLQENLQKALAAVKPAWAPKRSALPVLECVRLATDRGCLSVTATDFDIAITARCGAKVDAEGSVLIPFRALHDMVKELPPCAVNLEPRENGLIVEAGRAGITYPLDHDPADWPKMPAATGDRVEVDPRQLVAAIKQVVEYAATDDPRPVLAAVNCEFKDGALTMTAADGFRLATIDIPYGGTRSGTILIPARALAVIGKLCAKESEPASISWTEPDTLGQHGGVVFELGDHVEIAANLIRGTFPNYQQLIPDNPPTWATVDCDGLKTIVRQAAVAARDGSGILRLLIDSDTITVSAVADGVMTYSGQRDATVTGPAIKWAVNSRYLQDVLDLSAPTIEIGLTYPSTSAVFRNPENGARTIVMPMLVQW